MARIKEKNIAQTLRKNGHTISEILEKVNVSRSVISKWCRDIQLSAQQIKILADRQASRSYRGRLKAGENKRKVRIKEVKFLRKQGLKEVGKLNRRDIFIAGIAMYVSEGVTCPDKDEVSFCNSDPRMILFMLKWFKEICAISNDRFAVQIRINQIHHNRTKEVEKYWSTVTKIPLSQFTKTILIKSKSKKVYENCNIHYGTVRIMVHRGTKLRRKINGWIEGLI